MEDPVLELSGPAAERVETESLAAEMVGTESLAAEMVGTEGPANEMVRLRKPEVGLSTTSGLSIRQDPAVGSSG